jgi:heme-degrading monooxygenase HmoA
VIKVIEGHKVKPDTDIQDIFLQLRSNAIQYPGFVGAENLAGEQDASLFVFVSTWNTVEDWRLWETSRIRTELQRQTQKLLVEETKVSIYRVMATRW